MSYPGQEKIHDTLEKALNDDLPVESSYVMLSGWIVVAEYVDDEGAHWMSTLTSNHLPSWRRSGLLHEALYAEPSRKAD